MPGIGSAAAFCVQAGTAISMGAPPGVPKASPVAGKKVGGAIKVVFDMCRMKVGARGKLFWIPLHR